MTATDDPSKLTPDSAGRAARSDGDPAAVDGSLDERQLDRAGEALAAEAALARKMSAQRRQQAAAAYRDAREAAAHTVRVREQIGSHRPARPELDAPPELLRDEADTAPVGPSRGVALILREDPELGEGLSPEDRRLATGLLRARVIAAPPPRWRPPTCDSATSFGMLILDGLIGRRLRVGSAVATELLSRGDIVRPWDDVNPWNAIPAELDWRIFEPARLAVLDARVTRVIGRSPELLVAFSGRLMRRTEAAMYLMTVGHMTRVEDRLLAALWHLASRWGRVTSGGVRVPFHLTHELLGEVVGAQRPSVTTAVQHLQQRGELMRDSDGAYVLTGEPGPWTKDR